MPAVTEDLRLDFRLKSIGSNPYWASSLSRYHPRYSSAAIDHSKGRRYIDASANRVFEIPISPMGFAEQTHARAAIPNSIFISYRRSDQQHAAIALAQSLGWAFEGEVFFDRVSITGGDLWPTLLRQAAENARLLVAVIGSGWLSARDEHFRRSIDQPGDWVRQELLATRRSGAPILPVLLDDAEKPPREALDEELASLLYEHQELTLRVNSWEAGLHKLIETIASKTRLDSRKPTATDQLNPDGTPIPRPARQQSGRAVLGAAQLRAAVIDLSSWRLEQNRHPWATDGVAHELAGTFVFNSFANATAFMSEAAQHIDRWEPPHHPRWENQWRVLKVWFSTWDVGCRVTDLDVQAARAMDELYRTRDLTRCA